MEFPWILEHTKEVTDLQWLMVTGIGFLLVAWLVLAKVWPGMIRPHLVERHQGIIQAAEQVESTLRETKELRDDYRSRLEGIEHETKRRLEEAVHEAEALREQILAEAAANAKAIVSRGEEEVSRERAKAMVLLRRQFVEGVIGAAQYAASRSLGAPQHKRLIEEFTKELGARS